jgi:erythromycin esterase
MKLWFAALTCNNRLFLQLFASAVLIQGPTSMADSFSWLEQAALPLCKTESIQRIVDAASGRRLVLLGESTHGTHEYYVWRDQISRALIRSGNARFIAVEGDWAPLWELNLYVKNKPGAPDSAYQALKLLARWPTWMWANQETLDLVEWLRSWNAQQEPENQVGFYGMDVYAPWNAADQLIALFAEHNPEKLANIQSQLLPFTRHREDPAGLIRSESWHPSGLLRSMTRIEHMLNRMEAESDLPCHTVFAARQSVRVIRGAFHHYMEMGRGDGNSWNARVEHMKATVSHLLDHYGADSQGIVWAHNTHIGDARATTMRMRGDVNIGQLSRIRWGAEQVYAVGFATHRGTVKAGRSWEGTRELMEVPPAAYGSLEYLLNTRFPDGALLQFEAEVSLNPHPPVQQRAIGVVYRPESELGNYVQTWLSQRYDALVFLPETTALNPLHP